MYGNKLLCYHVVKISYGAIRQLPESYVDTLLHWGISVTMVKMLYLLLFHHCRIHQFFCVGYASETVCNCSHARNGAQ